jgi:hypothetical protein
MIPFRLAELEPAPAAVRAVLGLAPGMEPSPRSEDLLRRALALFRGLAAPAAVAKTVTATEFAPVFAGRGNNEPLAPLAAIFPRAARLQLFAFTLGEALGAEIARLFAGDFALAAVLDAVASQAAENAARAAERWAESLPAGGEDSLPASGADGAGPWRCFLYSPGYCGWHVSGQEALFAALRPETIGIRLNASFLMTPLKSVSGVLAAGPAAIHRLEASYPFCARCSSPACRERSLAGPPA